MRKNAIVCTILAILLASTLVPSVQAAVTSSGSKSPAEIDIGQWVKLQYNITSEAGDGYHNGTVYCNITDPDGKTTEIGSTKTYALHNAETDLLNWSFKPKYGGLHKVHFNDVNATQDYDAWVNFTVRRRTETLAEALNRWSVLFYFMGIVIVIIGLVTFFADIGTKKQKKPGKKK